MMNEKYSKNMTGRATCDVSSALTRSRYVPDARGIMRQRKNASENTMPLME